jgi:glycogen operon protein
LVAAYLDFVANGGDALGRFATFEAIAEARPGESWHRWPAELREPSDTAVAAFIATHETRRRFQLFLQFLCDRQFAEAAARARAAGLEYGFYRDLAVGAAPDGAEAWANSGYLARRVSIGAPPDRFSADGQVWNLPPPNAFASRQSGYQPFRELIAANMRHAGALRIDHVMGLTRLFWIPDGARPADGAYVSYPIDDLIGHLALESTNRHCMVVGEDLGTVPDGLRETLAAADVLSYRVLWFERDGIAFKPPAAYPAKAVACASTHDLPTLAGWWIGADIAERRALGQFSEEVAAKANALRRAEKEALARGLSEAGLLPAQPDFDRPMTQAFAAATIVWVAGSPAGLVLAQADDLAGETIATNLPGTDRERPNWRRKLGPDIDQLFASDLTRLVLDRLRAVRGTGR